MLRAGAVLGVASVGLTVVAMLVTRVSQNGKITLPLFVLGVAPAVVGLSATITGAVSRRPRHWLRYFVVGLIGNGVVVGLAIAFLCWIAFVGVVV